ncbi:MAG: hypothetical protein JSW58_08440 [Candidatus Latescibacterota bacterium]|nr:MAG: hypothetical protein JSW58_08440 [Candidatus Latescibacterota bacterium]
MSTTRSTTTTAPITPPPLTSPAKLLLHIKIVPRYNDEELVQHADDQINTGTTITGEPHEVPGFPIGNAVESYQGFLTCEIFWETIETDTDGEPDTDLTGDGLIVYAAEALCETQKIIEIDPAPSGFLHFVFRLRTAWGSSDYIDIDQYVYIASHAACGALGGDPTRTSSSVATPATTYPTVTSVLTTTGSTSLTTSVTTSITTSFSSTRSTSGSTSKSTSGSTSISSSASTSVSRSGSTSASTPWIEF